MIVTIDLDQLRQEAGNAQIPGGTPITAAEARRLACAATIIPAVLGGDSEVLDLDNAALLCSHHRHRAHDPACIHQRLPSGDIRFTRRT